MTTQRSDYAVKLFYSYSHKDTKYRDTMEKWLSLLKAHGALLTWSDKSILAGDSISGEIRKEIDDAEIVVFLLSSDFIDSPECRKEWHYAKELGARRPRLKRIPIIIRDCTWPDFLGEDDIKALPADGIPISNWDDDDSAWHSVYDGIKAVVEHLRQSFTAKPHFLADLRSTDFISQHKIHLDDLFVFPTLLCHGAQGNQLGQRADRIETVDELLNETYALIHGADRSGKTALARYVVLKLIEDSHPTLYVDLQETPQSAGEGFMRSVYHAEFHGDYYLWKDQVNKTLVADNLSGRPEQIELLLAAQEHFDQIFVTLSSTAYYAFFRDDSRLVDFAELQIDTLTQVQQEALIRRRLELIGNDAYLADGYIDRIEDRVNSIILDDRIVPRYPFFVLCILQTYEAYMPPALTITSYGHCYYVLIVASLLRAGISSRDSAINACLNFAEHLAFELYKNNTQEEAPAFVLSDFIARYKESYVIEDAIINRLKHEEFGILDSTGHFRTAYMHYYFLGSFLANDTPDNHDIIQEICDAIYVSENHLTLLFVIHHTSDPTIVDEVLVRTMCTLDDVAPARLDPEETRRFNDIVLGLPRNFLSNADVETERKRHRQAQDNAREQLQNNVGENHDDADATPELVNDIYRIMKNNQIMGQILRNKYGSIKREKIEEIIREVADGSLRLINCVLKDEEEIADMAQYLKTKNPEHDIAQIRNGLSFFSFVWTLMNIESIVASINVPEVKQSIHKVAEEIATPAYDLISYFTLLDAATELTEKEKNELARLFDKHHDPFIRQVLSMRTQHYINTHRSNYQIEQSICALLQIPYRARIIRR